VLAVLDRERESVQNRPVAFDDGGVEELEDRQRHESKSSKSKVEK
jgi:hypothetical protein